MYDQTTEKQYKTEKRIAFYEAAFALFSKKGIDGVTLQDVAEKSGYGVATLYRYFGTKANLVVETATWKWKQVLEGIWRKTPEEELLAMNAAESFAHFLDSFIALYREQRDLLRFNQFFNFYILSDTEGSGAISPYLDMIKKLEERFHKIYLKAERDQTIRTDISEEEMFSTALHLMLAVVTRFAVGLIYRPKGGSDDEKELESMKEALMRMYRTAA